MPHISSSGFPEIQKYCLISSGLYLCLVTLTLSQVKNVLLANSFTQWHCDFNGSTVWYYIAEGLKYFYIIYPTQHILEKYRQWHLKQKQEIWFPEYAQCTAQLVIVQKNEFLLLPSGCIHCVYTPVDSIAFGGNFLCDESIENQLKIEHLYHEIYSAQTVPCCHYFRDLNALRVIEYYFGLRHLQKKKKNKKKDVSNTYLAGKNALKNKQNVIDLCVQILFWQQEECKKRKKKKRKFRDDRLCKFELIDVHKLEPLVRDTLCLLGVNGKKLEQEKRRFLAKYPHYKVCNGLPHNAAKEQRMSDEDVDDGDEEYVVEDDDEEEKKSKVVKRRRSLRTAQRDKKVTKSKRKTRKKKKKSVSKGGNVRHECFKCKEQSAVRHMILFVCCNTYYHLRCAGYTTSRTQTAIQQHIDNGTINKQCPVCIKKGKRTQA